MRNVFRVLTLLILMVDQIWWDRGLSPYNHDPHFVYFVPHFTVSMPICSVGGHLLGVLFNPKFAGHGYRIIVAVDNLGSRLWICDGNLGGRYDFGSTWSFANTWAVLRF